MLDTKLLLTGYCSGTFPMAIDAAGHIAWFSPDPRALIPLDDRFHLSHSLRRTLQRGIFEMTVDMEFERVIRACAKTHGDTWISPEIVQSYIELHREGHAHSLETRRKGRLVGGLYGVHIGGAFFGESMFHLETDASKVALATLVERLRARGFALLDTQWMTPHLARFGAYEVSRTAYLRLLKAAVALERKFQSLA